MRANFTKTTKDIIAKRVGYQCSNPSCRKLTCGPQMESEKFLMLGVAAHIIAASQNGPRSDHNVSFEARKGIENGIWLCQTCAKLIDNDPKEYDKKKLKRWKNDAEKFALNKIAEYSSAIVHDPILLEQLSTFARVRFEYSLPSQSKIINEEFIQEATYIIYSMIGCAYLRASNFLKRDRFVFALSLQIEPGKNKVNISGELTTHLTPFGYYFGLLADMLNKADINQIVEYLEGSPQLSLRIQPAIGNFIPYIISRVDPTVIRIIPNKDSFIFKNGLVTTSDLLTFLARSTLGGPLVIDDINDSASHEKIMKLLDKIEDGFDLTEVSISTHDPENWEINKFY